MIDDRGKNFLDKAMLKVSNVNRPNRYIRIKMMPMRLSRCETMDMHTQIIHFARVMKRIDYDQSEGKGEKNDRIQWNSLD